MMDTQSIHSVIETGLTSTEHALTQMFALSVVGSGAPELVLQALFDAIETLCQGCDAPVERVYYHIIDELDTRLEKMRFAK